MISNGQILAMAVSAGISILLPLALLIGWRRRTHAPLRAAALGAAVFVLFVLVLERGLHGLVLSEGSVVLEKPWLYVLYACLSAGLFEETGRYLTFRYVLRRYGGRETGVMYGIGHGGMEAVLLCGINMAAYLLMAAEFNQAGGVTAAVQAYYSGVSVPALGLYYTPVWAFLVPGVERLAAMALHIALSVVVFQAARRPGKGRWYFYAVLLHAAVNGAAALYQIGILTSVAVTELIVTGLTLLICWRVTLLYLRDWTEEPAPEAEALCAGPEGGEALPAADGEAPGPERLSEAAPESDAPPAEAEAPGEAAGPSAGPGEPGERA